MVRWTSEKQSPGVFYKKDVLKCSHLRTATSGWYVKKNHYKNIQLNNIEEIFLIEFAKIFYK